ncbi:uncharacterized protein RCC_03384 [Ramularia collo-cygni]|uniref:Uncharacterized protein n=1 Tax=Ramularia collo-cygni TaxID=112498 RepID=A0A2D3UWN5_9PEZI|nr:uncharacterized protein RCC_03384 [Ramularia collo-cygni]CZT17550.1 uncharacterized protein RCC_03384 [Ramularia collo-cygni]
MSSILILAALATGTLAQESCFSTTVYTFPKPLKWAFPPSTLTWPVDCEPTQATKAFSARSIEATTTALTSLAADTLAQESCFSTTVYTSTGFWQIFQPPSTLIWPVDCEPTHATKACSARSIEATTTAVTSLAADTLAQDIVTAKRSANSDDDASLTIKWSTNDNTTTFKAAPTHTAMHHKITAVPAFTEKLANASSEGLTLTIDPTSPFRPGIIVHKIEDNIGKGWVGSVKTAGPCTTIVELACDQKRENYRCRNKTDNPKMTLTVAPDMYRLKYDRPAGSGQKKVNLVASCHIDDSNSKRPAMAACVHGRADLPADYKIETLTAREFIPITAGMTKIPTSHAACNTFAAASTAAAPAMILEVKKVVVPLVIAAGAQALL